MVMRFQLAKNETANVSEAIRLSHRSRNSPIDWRLTGS